MKLYVMTCGRLYYERAFLWHFGSKEDSGKEYEPRVFCCANLQYFIDHPAARIVFDLGYKLEEFSKPRDPNSRSDIRGFPTRRGPDGRGVIQAPDENPVAQLQKIGVSVDDIDYVVISHLMVEHAGWLPAFAGKKARIIVQRKEYDYARRIALPISGEPPVEQFHSWMYARHHFDIPGLNYQFIEGDYELAKDVTVLDARGHTPGYQMMRLRLPRTGTVVLSPCEHLGMYYAVPIHGNGPGIPHSFTWFAGQELQTFKMIRELVAREKGQIFCGHDWDQSLTLKHAPEYYE